MDTRGERNRNGWQGWGDMEQFDLSTTWREREGEFKNHLEVLTKVREGERKSPPLSGISNF